MPTNCLSVFGHFVVLAFKGLNSIRLILEAKFSNDLAIIWQRFLGFHLDWNQKESSMFVIKTSNTSCYHGVSWGHCFSLVIYYFGCFIDTKLNRVTYFWPMFPFYIAVKTPKNLLWFSGVFRGYKMGTLARKRLRLMFLSYRVQSIHL